MHNTLPATIRASVGDKILKRAPELFDQKPQTIFSELLQNARRAGATAIDVTIRDIGVIAGAPQSTVTIADNGSGITDPQTLVAFGGSGWDLALDYRENAAGMGFFSLARYGAKVHSLGWSARISPAAFKGDEDIIVAAAPQRSGTSVEFSIVGTASSLAKTFCSEALYLPLTVHLNGDALAQRQYLEGAIYTAEMLGVRIGVFESETGSIVTPEREGRVCFFGHATEGRGLASVSEAAAAPERRRADRPYQNLYPLIYYTKVEVVDAPDLKLVLPTRDRVIEDDAWKAVCAATERAVYEAIAAKPTHFLSAKDFKRARTLGVAIEEPKALPLYGYSASTEDGSESFGPGRSVCVRLDARSKGTPTGLIRFPDLERWEAIPVASALQGTPLPYTLIEAADSFDGYSAYDAIPVAEPTFEVRHAGGTTLLAAKGDGWAEQIETIDSNGPSCQQYRLVDGINMILSAKGFPSARLPVVALPTSEERGGDAHALIVRSAKVGDVVEALWNATWYSDEDDESDTSDYCARELAQQIRTLLMPKADARAASIRELLDAHLGWILRGGTDSPRVTNIAFTPGPGGTVLIAVTYEDGVTVHEPIHVPDPSQASQ